MRKTKILIAGHCSLDPLGRHFISWVKALLHNDANEIYIENSYLLNDYDTLNDVFAEELKTGKLHFSDDVPHDYEYDFLIFTDSISLNPWQGWEVRLFDYNAKIKICYPVYDGSVPPLHWIDIINNNFDICLSPSEYCAHNLRRYGINIDCFGLECAVLIEDFLKIKPFQKQDGVFRIGSIGASDFRKNMPLLMRSFAKAFSKKDKVELFIHSSYGKDITCDDEILKVYEECSKNSNIVLQLKKISQSEMNDLWASFDAYVSPQTTTGYFTTPLEACAVGLPVILSDIHPHLELKKFIPEEDNLFFVKHPNLSTAFHWVFEYRQLGVKFDADEAEYTKIFKQIYKDRKKLSAPDLIKQRKENAKKITAAGLSKLYNLICHPENIAIAKKVSHIDEEQGVFFMSETLAQKYEKFGFGKLQKLTDNYKEKVYPEEKSPVFQALEKSAVDSQNIWFKQNTPDDEPNILQSKRMKKFLRRANDAKVTRVPRFIYEQFSWYCRFKLLFKRIKKIIKK